MNIRDIMTQTNVASSQGTGNVFDGSMLAIGSKGQVVEGVISGVSDQISINFNGVEVAVPHAAVQDATEGETRKFQIMDVSKDNIVLKEVGKSDTTAQPQAMVNTTVNSSSYTYANQVSESAQTTSAKTEMNANLAVLTGDDYKQIEGQEGSLEDCQEEYIDRAVEQMKQQQQRIDYNKEQSQETSQEFEESLEQIQATGFMSEKSQTQIMEALEQSNIPATQANVNKIATALQMSQTVSDMTDDTKAYIVGQDLTPTIENIYHGQYSGSDAIDGSFYDDGSWQDILPQVEEIISLSGVDTESGMESAQWLYANDLPITTGSIQKMDVLQNISDDMSVGTIFNQILQSMSAGGKAEQASLDTSEFVIAKSIIADFAAVTDQDIITAVQLSGESDLMSSGDESGDGELSLELLRQAASYNQSNGNGNGQSGNSSVIQTVVTDDMSEEQIQAVTAKRQIAEICLKMTAQSVNNMAAKGIDVETAPLQEIVDELRDTENAYYKAQLGEDAATVTDAELDLMHETLEKTADIANAPAALIGSSVRQQDLLTLNELHAAATSDTFQRQQFMQVYETVATEVSSEYGDSIQKAFEGIPEILSDLGLEDTSANERAVRILGYNSMELTADNISAVKEYDATVNRIVDNMQPSTVLEMIRDGNNPLDTSIADLDQQLMDINESKDLSSEDKYSRYLWQLEKNDSISEQERDGYIGVYRLLNNIEKTDGAAIGAVMQTNQEMTLGNLLTAVRTMKSSIDTKVDDEFGGLTDLVYSSSSITQQIENGFNSSSYSTTSDSQSGSGYGENSNADSGSSTQRYYDALVADALDSITPDKLQEVSDGDMEKMLDTSVEKFAEEMKNATGKPEIESAYYDQQAEKLRDTVADDVDVVEYLDYLQVPSTIANIAVTSQVLDNGYSSVKECYNRRNVLDEEEQAEFEDAVSDIADSLDSEESIQKACQNAEKYMEDILENSYEVSDIKSQDVDVLSMLGQSLELTHMLVGRRCYDIPIQIGDTVTTMNLTIVTGYEDTGKVQITMDNTESDSEEAQSFGNVSAELRISGTHLKGTVFCSERASYEDIKENSDTLEQALESEGLEVNNISYGMNYVSRSAMLNDKLSESDTDTANLYKAAKVLVKYITDRMKSED